MWLAIPFLLVVVIAIPILVYMESRKADAPTGDAPAPPPARTTLYVQIIVNQAIIAGLAWLALYGAGLKINWLGQFRFETVLIAVGAVVAALVLALWLSRREVSDPTVPLALMPRSPSDWALWLMVMAVAAVGEEFVYRGVLFGLTSLVIDGWVLNALIGAVLFGLAHKSQGWVGVWASAIFAFVFQFLVLRSGGLALAIAAHFAYDVLIQLLSRRETLAFECRARPNELEPR